VQVRVFCRDQARLQKYRALKHRSLLQKRPIKETIFCSLWGWQGCVCAGVCILPRYRAP